MTSFVVKAAPWPSTMDRLRFDEKTMWGGKDVRSGDEVFVFAAEHNGGQGLYGRGLATEAVRGSGSRVGLTVKLTDRAIRPLGRAELRVFRDRPGAGPETEIDHKLYRQATNKIAGVSEAAAVFLRGFFEETADRDDGEMKKIPTAMVESASRLIDARIEQLNDWRGNTLSRLRALIIQADPEVVEEWKWRGVPVWSHDGLICTGETYKSVVKLTFARGASLEDPSGLFNASLEGRVRRAMDLHESDDIDEEAFKTLIRAAVARNRFSAR